MCMAITQKTLDILKKYRQDLKDEIAAVEEERGAVKDEDDGEVFYHGGNRVYHLADAARKIKAEEVVEVGPVKEREKVPVRRR